MPAKKASKKTTKKAARRSSKTRVAYTVLSGRSTLGKPGDVVYDVPNARSLIAGGHLRRNPEKKADD